MYFFKAYFTENNSPTEVEIICNKCGNYINISDMSLFDKVQSDYCIISINKTILCNCGNICGSGIVEPKKLQTIKEVTKSSHSSYTNIPNCPKCNSTAITASARGVNMIWGFIGASKTVNRCANCGYTWKP